MCESSIFKIFFLVFTTLHCQSTDRIRIRSGSGGNFPDPTKKVRIRNPGGSVSDTHGFASFDRVPIRQICFYLCSDRTQIYLSSVLFSFSRKEDFLPKELLPVSAVNCTGCSYLFRCNFEGNLKDIIQFFRPKQVSLMF